MKAKTQTEAVLNHLKNKGSITSLEAINKYGATRLSGIIYNLRRHHNITSEQFIVKNRFGNTSNCVRYIYEGELKNERN